MPFYSWSDTQIDVRFRITFIVKVGCRVRLKVCLTRCPPDVYR